MTNEPHIGFYFPIWWWNIEETEQGLQLGFGFKCKFCLLQLCNLSQIIQASISSLVKCR